MVGLRTRLNISTEFLCSYPGFLVLVCVCKLCLNMTVLSPFIRKQIWWSEQIASMTPLCFDFLRSMKENTGFIFSAPVC